MSETLIIKDLHVNIDGKEILKGINLEVKQGEVHAIMGPNGSGKSTLAYSLAGHPHYKVTAGQARMGNVDLLNLSPDGRARAGLFLAFQYPTAIPGVSMANFLRTALNAVKGGENGAGIPITEFRRLMLEKMELLKMDISFARRYLNEGFSGGEKKRAEILQMALLEPKFAIMDETDSGLDIDALRIVSEGVNAIKGPNMGVVVITHYNRILNYIKPNFVHILYLGRIIHSGGPELAEVLEAEGYDNIIKEYGPEAV